MSYDIRFKVKVQDKDKYVSVGCCDANITYNVSEMIKKSTGLEWINEANNGLVKDVIPNILKGYNELYLHPEKYKKYEASNGWGTVEGCKKFFHRILNSWEEFLYDHEDLEDCTYFWIV